MGRDKATLPFSSATGDTTLVEHAVTTLACALCAGLRGRRTRAAVARRSTPRCCATRCAGWGRCWRPAAGLRAAAEAGLELAFVCAVDMPYLDVELIDELVGPAVRLGADVVLPWDGRDHYLAGVYRTALAARADELVAAGERSMRALVTIVDTQRIVMPEQRALTNVNTAADLALR